MALACELYLKAIAENKKVVVGKSHDLNKIFLKLSKEIQKEIYDIWRGKIGQKLPEHPYVSKMFSDNLEANAKVFTRLGYDSSGKHLLNSSDIFWRK